MPEEDFYARREQKKKLPQRFTAWREGGIPIMLKTYFQYVQFLT